MYGVVTHFSHLNPIFHPQRTWWKKVNSKIVGTFTTASERQPLVSQKSDETYDQQALLMFVQNKYNKFSNI